MLSNLSVNKNISLINTIYHRPRKENNKWFDAITLIWKDNDTGQKFHKCIIEPEYEYFMLKEGLALDNNELFIERDKVEPIRCKYMDIEKDIAERTGNLDFFYNNIKSGNRYSNRYLHTHKSVFMSDAHIQDYYMFRFSREYGINDTKLTKSFLDIEVDIIDIMGDFPEPGEAPINAVTLIDGTSNNVYTLLLRNNDNDLIYKFEQDLNKDAQRFFNKLNNTICDVVGGKDNMKAYKLDDLNFNIKFFDEEDEILLISEIFNIINTTKVDFVLAWNMAFDIPYIIERIKVLGYDPSSIMCHPDMEIKDCYYYIDERNRSDFHLRGDYACISSYTVFLDQLIHFASRRSGQSLFPSYKLDDIGEIIAKVKKLDYSHITTRISDLPYKDYEVFVMYNIIDTIVQKAIEDRAEDIEFVYNKSIMNSTRYDKCHRNTIYLKNRGMVEFLKEGLVIGNNTNLDNEKEKYPGGLVSEPHLNEPNGIRINDSITTLYDNAVDYDYKSLYPSLMREFNLAPHTQIGKILIESCLYKNENEFNDPDYDRSGAFLDTFISGNYLILCQRYMEMASFKELIYDALEYFGNMGFSKGKVVTKNNKGLEIPYYISGKSYIAQPVDFINKGELIKPYRIIDSAPKGAI